MLMLLDITLQGIFWWYQKKVVSLQTISNHDFIEN